MCSAVRSSGLLTLFEEASSLRKLLVVVDRCGGRRILWEFNSSDMYKVTNLGKSGRRFSAGQCVPNGLNILVTQAAATRSPSAIMFEGAKDGI